jgi:hypothetical protein
MLEMIAVKKGLMETVPNDSKKGKKTKQVPNQAEAAKRLIRDFLNNRLRFYSKI